MQSLIPLEGVFVRNSSQLGVSPATLIYLLQKLGYYENLQGEITSDRFIAINGEEFLIDLENQLLDSAIRIVAVNEFEIVLDGFPLSRPQRIDLEFEIAFVKSWMSMPNDIFYQLIENEKISGKDLFSLCRSDKLIDEKCNSRKQEIFRRLLLKEYGIESSGDHRSQYFERSKAHAWTFGLGKSGQLGHGDNLERLSPKMIIGFEGIKQVSCGGVHTAIIDSQNRIWTFGDVSNGQLGHGEQESYQLIPMMIVEFEGIKQVSCGGAHTSIIDSQDQIWTFGSGNYGELGHSNYRDQFIPKMILGFKGIKQVSCGGDHNAMIM